MAVIGVRHCSTLTCGSIGSTDVDQVSGIIIIIIIIIIRIRIIIIIKGFLSTYRKLQQTLQLKSVTKTLRIKMFLKVS